MGSYTLKMRHPHFENWMREDGKWGFSYFYAGDYHLKGKKGVATAYQEGLFDGQLRVTTEQGKKKASPALQAEGHTEYLFCVQNIVPVIQS